MKKGDEEKAVIARSFPLKAGDDEAIQSHLRAMLATLDRVVARRGLLAMTAHSSTFGFFMPATSLAVTKFCNCQASLGALRTNAAKRAVIPENFRFVA